MQPVGLLGCAQAHHMGDVMGVGAVLPEPALRQRRRGHRHGPARQAVAIQALAPGLGRTARRRQQGVRLQRQRRALGQPLLRVQRMADFGQVVDLAQQHPGVGHLGLPGMGIGRGGTLRQRQFTRFGRLEERRPAGRGCRQVIRLSGKETADEPHGTLQELRRDSPRRPSPRPCGYCQRGVCLPVVCSNSPMVIRLASWSGACARSML